MISQLKCYFNRISEVVQKCRFNRVSSSKTRTNNTGSKLIFITIRSFCNMRTYNMRSSYMVSKNLEQALYLYRYPSFLLAKKDRN